MRTPQNLGPYVAAGSCFRTVGSTFCMRIKQKCRELQTHMAPVEQAATVTAKTCWCQTDPTHLPDSVLAHLAKSLSLECMCKHANVPHSIESFVRSSESRRMSHDLNAPDSRVLARPHAQYGALLRLHFFLHLVDSRVLGRLHALCTLAPSVTQESVQDMRNLRGAPLVLLKHWAVPGARLALDTRERALRVH